MADDYDVIIVGGGPAGLSAGIVFASQGLRTLIFDQKKLPADKICGEGVMPKGLTGLEKLHVKQKLRPGEYRPFIGVRYIMEGLPAVSGKFPDGPGWGIRRTTLSEAFLRRIKELEYLEIRSGLGEKVRNFKRTNNRISVEHAGRDFRARLLVGADGLNSQVRSWARLEGPPSNIRRWGARQHYLVKPWSEYVEVYWGHGLEAYITPCGEGMVGVATLWDRKRYPKVQGGRELVSTFINQFPTLCEHLSGATTCGDLQAIGPLSRQVKSPITDGVLLIGDAAGYLDAITGEGIGLAVTQALAMNQTVVPIMKKKRAGIMTTEELSHFATISRKIYTTYTRMTHLALFLSRHPKYAHFAIYLFGKYPRVFEQLLSENMGKSEG
jgi:menaquinone-9 beta-reductase